MHVRSSNILYISLVKFAHLPHDILASQVPGWNLLLNPSWLVDLPGRRSSFFWFGTPKASRRPMIQLLKSYFKELMRMITRRSEVGRSQSPRRIRKSPSDPALLLPRILLTVGLLLPLPRRIDSIHCCSIIPNWLRFCRLCAPTCAYGSSRICPVLSLFSGKGKKKKSKKDKKTRIRRQERKWRKRRKRRKKPKLKGQSDLKRKKKPQKRKKPGPQRKPNANSLVQQRRPSTLLFSWVRNLYISKPKNYSIYIDRSI